MANQAFRVTGSPAYRRSQGAALNARLALLPQMIENQNRAQDIERNERQFRMDYNLARKSQRQSQMMSRKQLAQSQAESRMGMGLEGIKLGTSVAQNFGNKQTFGGLFGGGGSGSKAPGGFFGNLGIGSTIGSGLAGFGAASLLGGGKRSTAKKSALGIGAGALLGLASGGASGAISGALTGGFGGTIASLF